MNLKVKPTDKILIVAPHSDDETLGCGGLLAKYGNQIDVLLVTDGRLGFCEKSTNQNPDTIAKIREEEFTAVCNYFNVNDRILLRVPNENIPPYINRLKRFDLRKYNYIFIPSRVDSHIDHKIVNKTIKKMYVHQRCRAKMFEYEIWVPLSNPNYLLNISDVIDTKLAAMSLYESQLECYDYVSLAKGLNMYRGAVHLEKYLEMYYHKKTVREYLKQLRRKFNSIVKR